MKILTVVYDLNKGGTQRAAQIFAEAYHELKHDSRVLALYELGSRHDEIKDFISVWHKLTNENLDLINKWNPDIVHIHSHGPELRDIEKLINGISKETRIIETNVFSTPSPWADKIHVSYQLSNWAQWVFNLRGGDKFNSVIVPYPIKCDSFKKASEKDINSFKSANNIPENAFVIGRIGQSYPGKWSPMLLKAFNDIAEVRLNIYLLIINPPQNIIEHSNNSPFKNRIIHIPRIIGDENLAIAYSSMDIMLHTAEQGESFGMVLPESILCGTPVVTLSTPWADNSQCEVVENSKGGYVVNSLDGIRKAISIISNVDNESSFTFEDQHIKEKYDHLKVAKKAITFSVLEKESIKFDKSLIHKILENSLDKPKYLTKIFISINSKIFRKLTMYSSNYSYWYESLLLIKHNIFKK